MPGYNFFLLKAYLKLQDALQHSLIKLKYIICSYDKINLLVFKNYSKSRDGIDNVGNVEEKIEKTNFLKARSKQRERNVISSGIPSHHIKQYTRLTFMNIR